MMNYTKILKKIFILCITLLLNGCINQECIEADDFGFNYVTIPVYEKNGIHGFGLNQYVPWIDSKLTINGEPLVIMVKDYDWMKGGDNKNTKVGLSAWCPWYSSAISKGLLSESCLKFPKCEFNEKNDIKYYEVNNAPCLMDQGKGLYVALVRSGYDINANAGNTNFSENDVLTVHLAEELDGELTELDVNGLPKKTHGLFYLPPENSNKIGGKLYFKILNNYYSDNSGQYIVKIKSGVASTESNIFQRIINYTKQILFNSPEKNYNVTNKINDDNLKSSLAEMKVKFSPEDNGIIYKIFNNITAHKTFQGLVKLLLIIYVSFVSLAYLIGLIQMSTFELLGNLIKIIVISILLTPGSWNFFYNYLFIFFIDGANELMLLIDRAAGGSGEGPGSIMSLMVTKETWAKLSAILFSSLIGFLYFLLYCFLLMYLFFVLLSFVQTITLALIVTSMLIAMAPFFLCCCLFKLTNNFFKNWLRHLVLYSLQPIILVAGISFMSMMIRHEIYTTLGFKICQNIFIGNWYIWNPQINNNANAAQPMSIYVPENHWQTEPISFGSLNDICTPNPRYNNIGLINSMDESSAYNRYCKSYECKESRLPELPFLDLNIQRDCDKAKEMLKGNIVKITPLLMLTVIIFLLSKFNEVAPNIGEYIFGSFSGGSSRVIQNKSLTSAFGLNKYIKNSRLGKTYNTMRTYTNPLNLLNRQALTYIPSKAGGAIAKRIPRSLLRAGAIALTFPVSLPAIIAVRSYRSLRYSKEENLKHNINNKHKLLEAKLAEQLQGNNKKNTKESINERKENLAKNSKKIISRLIKNNIYETKNNDEIKNKICLAVNACSIEDLEKRRKILAKNFAKNNEEIDNLKKELKLQNTWWKNKDEKINVKNLKEKIAKKLELKDKILKASEGVNDQFKNVNDISEFTQQNKRELEKAHKLSIQLSQLQQDSLSKLDAKKEKDLQKAVKEPLEEKEREDLQRATIEPLEEKEREDLQRATIESLEEERPTNKILQIIQEVEAFEEKLEEMQELKEKIEEINIDKKHNDSDEKDGRRRVIKQNKGQSE